MKKVVLVFLLVVLGTIEVVMGQYTVSPVKKVIPGHNYTINDLKNFINSNDPLVEDWNKTFLALLQTALLNCNEDLFILKNKDQREAVLEIIDKYCFLNRIDLASGFVNSGRTSGNKMKFINDPRSFENIEFLAFEYGSCHKDIVKMNCFNLPDLPVRKIYVSKPEPKPKSEPERVVEHRWQDFQGNYQEQKKDNENKEIVIVDDSDDSKPEKTWFGRNWGYVAGGAAVLVVGGVIVYNKTRPINNYTTIIVPPPVTPGGPGGAPTTVVPATGGPGGANTTGFTTRKIVIPVRVGIIINF